MSDPRVRAFIAPRADEGITDGTGLDPTECSTCKRDTCDGGCSGTTAPRVFEQLDEGYRMRVDAFGVEFSIDRLRRDSHALWGELAVRTTMPGALTNDGVLAVADFNLSSQRAREDRARFLEKRSRASEIDWLGLIEDFVQRIITAERAGQPAILLRDLPRPQPDESLTVDGFPLLARHPTVLFGDGGAAKSYLALYLAGRLEQAGHRVGLFDWELAGEDHRDRLERLFGAAMPAVRYARCVRPLVHEVDRLRRIVRDERLDYLVLDSVAFACDGPPEAAEVAGRYFQAVRQLGAIGTLHVAHISKADGADQKPFGSVFWHNGARATWFAKLIESGFGADRMTVGLFNRKANLGGLRSPVAFDITFTPERTVFRRANLADVPDLAAKLPIRHRMAQALRNGSMSADALAKAIGADVESVKRKARAYPAEFTLLPGGQYGLAERRSS